MSTEASCTVHSSTWSDVLHGEREQPYFLNLLSFVENERRAGKSIYPSNLDVFNALSLTAFDDVKVVIIGQDPYHGPNQAHGLSFSVRPPTPPPPSLVNIFLELEQEFGFKRPTHGSLESWAHQGVLLLNAVLTVEEGKAGSHANKGWERFTDAVISRLNEERDNLVFMLWGNYAQKKGVVINPNKHLVLKSVHPSPLSAYNGFFGSKHFSKANSFLKEKGIATINW